MDVGEEPGGVTDGSESLSVKKQSCGLLRAIIAGTGSLKETLVAALAVGFFIASVASVATYVAAWATSARSGFFYATDPTVIWCYSVAGGVFLPVALYLILRQVLRSRGSETPAVAETRVPSSLHTALIVFMASLPVVVVLWLATWGGGTWLVRAVPGEGEWLGIAVVCLAGAFTLVAWLVTWRMVQAGFSPTWLRRIASRWQEAEDAAEADAPVGWLPRLMASFRERRTVAALVVGLACGSVPLVIACYGYGSYLRYSWFFVAPAVVVVGHALVGTVLLIREGLLLLGGAAPDGDRGQRYRLRLLDTLLFCAMFLLGWGAGVLCREAYARAVRRRCEPVLAALETYRSVHGSYPTDLSQIPGIDGLIEESGVTIVGERFGRFGLPLGKIDEADAVVYLVGNRWECVVPIEQMPIMSFTRFYVYLKASDDPDWQHHYLIWQWYATSEDE
jgi:hypothetical protein